MKKAFCMMLIIVILLMCSTAYADPASNAGTPASNGSSGLIAYKSTGETVVRIQMRLRELCYFNFKPTGNFQSMTVDSTIKFQQNQLDSNGQAIIADGTVGAQSMGLLFSSPTAVRAVIDAPMPIGKPLAGVPTVTGSLISWKEVLPTLQIGATYTITDYNTGVTYNMLFTGGVNHAEMECAEATSTAVFKDAFGGEFNYSKRPVVIQINGQGIAASLQGWPHGEDTVSLNDMNGHVCLFFYESLSHVGSLPDVEHLNQVYVAAGRS
ncbi:MAG: hypothetical protein RR232_00480 [Clostridia bacterium]